MAKIRLLIASLVALTASAQNFVLQPAPRVELPEVIDGNTSAMWADGKLYIFHSSGAPTRSSGADQFHLDAHDSIDFQSEEHKPVWFEAVWRDPDGTLFLWYHNEPGGVCPGSDLTAPRIGAAVSYDNGKTVQDLGIVLESGDAFNCDAENGFFAGGHGDFSVVLDRDKKYFYFLFTNYGGVLEEQGVAIARMAFADRFHPSGTVHKYYRGAWEETGRGGHMTPIFPAVAGWGGDNTDSFWGPSVHWNTGLESFVVLLNRSCCEPGWPQEGIYIARNIDLSNPEAFTHPRKILSAENLPKEPGYYPQVLGLGEGETDSLAGGLVRLYVHGVSEWQIQFLLDDPDPNPPGLCPEFAAVGCSDPDGYSGRNTSPARSVRTGISPPKR